MPHCSSLHAKVSLAKTLIPDLLPMCSSECECYDYLKQVTVKIETKVIFGGFGFFSRLCMMS